MGCAIGMEDVFIGIARCGWAIGCGISPWDSSADTARTTVGLGAELDERSPRADAFWSASFEYRKVSNRFAMLTFCDWELSVTCAPLVPRSGLRLEDPGELDPSLPDLEGDDPFGATLNSLTTLVTPRVLNAMVIAVAICSSLDTRPRSQAVPSWYLTPTA
jgi:hypothetical protein